MSNERFQADDEEIDVLIKLMDESDEYVPDDDDEEDDDEMLVATKSIQKSVADKLPIGAMVGLPWNDYVGEGTKYPTVGGPKRLALLGKVYFSKENENADKAFRQVIEEPRTLGGGSISFLPIGNVAKNKQGGNHYTKWKLLEFTVTPIGSNPDSIPVGFDEVDNRIVTYILTTDTLDRDGESVDPEGGDFEEYAKNPAILFDHNSGEGKKYKRAKTMTTKFYTKGKSARLKSAPDAEMETYLEERGLDDVQISDEEPIEEGWTEEEYTPEENKGADADYNAYAADCRSQGVSPISKPDWLKIDADERPMTYESKSKSDVTDPNEELKRIKDAMSEKVGDDAEAVERCACKMVDDGEDEELVQMAKSLIKRQIKAKRAKAKSLPPGKACLDKLKSAIEAEVGSIEQPRVRQAMERMLKEIGAASKAAYSDLDEPNEDVPPGDEMGMKSKSTGVKRGDKVTWKGEKWEVLTLDEEAEEAQIVSLKDPDKDAIVTIINGVVSEKKSLKSKRLSKATMQKLKELDEYLESVGSGSDKVAAAGAKYYSKELKSLYEEPAEEVVEMSEDDLSEEDRAAMAEAVGEFKAASKALSSKWFQLTCQKI